MAITTMYRPDSFSEALDSENRTFKGDPKTGESADLTGVLPHEQFDESAMSGHPATESEEPEGESDSEESHFTYASHGEAEKAALQTEQAVAYLSNELREVQDLALQTLQRGDHGQPSMETPGPETPADFMKRTRKEALDEIEALDWDDEDHKEKVAEIQARADEDILKCHQEESRELKVQQQRYQSEVNAIIDQAEKAMEDAGLNSERGSPDSTLFWGLSQLAPKDLSMDDQIAYCIDALTKYKGSPRRERQAGGSKEGELDSTERPASLF